MQALGKLLPEALMAKCAVEHPGLQTASYFFLLCNPAFVAAAPRPVYAAYLPKDPHDLAIFAAVSWQCVHGRMVLGTEGGMGEHPSFSASSEEPKAGPWAMDTP